MPEALPELGSLTLLGQAVDARDKLYETRRCMRDCVGRAGVGAVCPRNRSRQRLWRGCGPPMGPMEYIVLGLFPPCLAAQIAGDMHLRTRGLRSILVKSQSHAS